MSFREFYEAQTAGRAWNGRLAKIERLLTWMYDQNILTKTEKEQKDAIFRQYYRYYNDGDFPRGLYGLGIRSYSSKEEIEDALEEYLSRFIRRILSKYLPKIDRTDFNYQDAIKSIDNILNVVSKHYSSLTIKTFARHSRALPPEFSKALEQIEIDEKKICDQIAKINPNLCHVDLKSAINSLRETGKLTPEIEAAWEDLITQMDTKLYPILQSVKRSLEKARQLHILNKSKSEE